MKKVLFIIVDRANYGRIFSLIDQARFYNFDVKTCFTGTTLEPLYGNLAKRLEDSGFRVDFKVNAEIPGRSHSSMTLSIAKAIQGMNDLYSKWKPDVSVVIGDRYEALGCSIATVYNNIYLAHIQGGEISGSIDETTRHMITKMAHIHFPATKRSGSVIRQLGEEPGSIHVSGCPVGDYIKSISKSDVNDCLFASQSTDIPIEILRSRRYILASLHPVTTDIEDSSAIVADLLKALTNVGLPVVWIRPNADAGSENIDRLLMANGLIYPVVNIMPQIYHILLYGASLAIGNSSSFVRDSSFSGVPVIIVGQRQSGREYADNVIFTSSTEPKYLFHLIMSSLNVQRYKTSDLYGRGNACEIILNKLDEFLSNPPSLQKSFVVLDV